jgi:general stress protein YciG
MAGTKAGGAKCANRNLERTEVTIDGKTIKIEPGTFYQVVGASGGKKGTTGGFYANRELAREAGARGGRISRRGKKV